MLPPHWIMTTFGNICGAGQYGWTTKAATQGVIKFLRTTDITKDQIDWQSVPYCHDIPLDIDKYQIQTNDILISRSGSVGFSTLISNTPYPTVFASYLIRFIPSKNVEAGYVAYFLKSSRYWQQISEAAAGVAVSNINAKKLSAINIPLPPLNEQKRIADKLDTLFARVDACRDRLECLACIIKRFRQSILAAATSGELTENWREENPDVESAHELLIRLQENFSKGCITSKVQGLQEAIKSEQAFPVGWSYAPVKTLGEIFLGRQRSPKNHTGPNMYPYVRSANVTWNGWNLSDVKEMNFDSRDFEKYKLRVGAGLFHFL